MHATQCACPIGFAKADQKYEGCYAAIANLPPRLRFTKSAILLLELTNSKAFKQYGAARVLSGIRSDGERISEPCFADDMRRLQEGVRVQIPNADGGTRPITLKAWVVGLSADFPAAGALLPFMESTSAHVWCRECDLNFSEHSLEKLALQAELELETTQVQLQRKRQKCGCSGGWPSADRACHSPGHARSAASLKADLARLRALKKSGTNVAKEMQSVRTSPPS